MKARKLEPPAISDGDRALWHSAPGPRTVDETHADYVDKVAPRQAFDTHGRMRNLTHAEQARAVGFRPPAQPKALPPKSDASLTRPVFTRGGNRPNPKTSSARQEYRQTEREAYSSDMGRYVGRVIETQSRFEPLTAEERLAFRQENLDAEDTRTRPRGEDADAYAAVADLLDEDARKMRERNDARMRALGIHNLA